MDPSFAKRRSGDLLLFAATSLSGAAALAHQTVWVRALIDILGANADTFSKVVGAFFLGLAGGAWIASRNAPHARAWLWIAGAEAAVILSALPILACHHLALPLYSSAIPGWCGPWLLPLLLIVPPAMAMGLVLPWVIHALALEGRLDGKWAVALYALNTAGGIGGIAFVLLWSFPNLGLVGTALCVLGLNAAVIGLLLLRHACSRIDQSPAGAALRQAPPTAGPTARERFLAFASGFLVLAMEVLFKHQFAQISINSLYSGAVVLAVVLTALSVAPLLLALMLRQGFRPVPLLAAALLVAGLLCLFQPLHFMLLGHGLEMIPYRVEFWRYSFDLFRTGLLYLGAPLVAGGLVFPLLLHRAGSRGETGAGVASAKLFLWSGLGGWAGAEAANVIIGPLLGLWSSLTAVGLAYLVCAAVAGSGLHASRRRPGIVLLAAAGAAALVTLVPVARLPMIDSDYGEVVEARLAKEGVVAVVEPRPGNRRMVMNHTYILGGSRARAHQERQAHLPLLLHGAAESVAFIGIATGSTVAGAMVHPTVRSVEAIDISWLTIQFAANHFSELNRDLFQDPRLVAIHDDARWVIARRPAAYDVVVGDLFLPWRTGTGRLYSVEHFEAVKRSLRPDGIFCQWLPLYQLTEEQFRVIAGTFRAVFPQMILIRGDFFHEKPIIGLVGPVDLEQHDWPRTAEAIRKLRDQNQVDDPLVRHAEGLAMMLLGAPPDDSREDLLNTLANARAELSAAREILGHQHRWFSGLPFAEYAGAVQAANAGFLPDFLREAQASGQFFLDLELAHGAGLAKAPKLRRLMEERLPASLRSDPGSNWYTWPGHERPDYATAFEPLSR